MTNGHFISIIMNTTTTLNKKPAPLRVIFILNGLMMILPFVFYAVFTINDIKVGDLQNIYMVYTGLAYILSFGILIWTILNKKLMMMRAVFGLNILIAFPAGAFIGMLFAIISFALSFNKKVKDYFAS